VIARTGNSGLLLAALLLPASAGAQALKTPPLAIERLGLDPSGRGSLLGGAAILPEGTLRLAVAGHYERDPLVLQFDNDATASVVARRVTAHLTAALGICDRWEFGLELPLIAYQAGDDLARYGVSAVDATGLGNPLLRVRFALLAARADAPLALSAGLGLSPGIGSEGALGGSGWGGTALLPQVAAGHRLGPATVTAQLAAELRAARALDTRELGSVGVAQVGIGLHDSAWSPEVSVRAVVPFAYVPIGVEALAAVRRAVAANVEAFALAGAGFGELPGTPVWRALAGVAWTVGGAPAAPRARLDATPVREAPAWVVGGVPAPRRARLDATPIREAPTRASAELRPEQPTADAEQRP